MKLIINIVGWFGTFLVVTSYALAATGILNSNLLLYQIIVAVGCSALMILNYYNKVYQNLMINTIIFVFSMYGIFIRL